jgi:hypothetical protein
MTFIQYNPWQMSAIKNKNKFLQIEQVAKLYIYCTVCAFTVHVCGNGTTNES